MIKGIRHMGLVVKDPERALSFYRDILGFVVLTDRLESGPFIEALLDLRGVRVRTIKMKVGGGALLELLHFEPGVSAAGPKNITHHGFSHIAFTVENVDVCFNRLKDKQVSFVSAPMISDDGKAKVFFCRDHEGNHLEFVEELA